MWAAPSSSRKTSAARARKRKYTLIPSVLQGKRVFILEDSIVRSTTLLTLVRQLRQIGGAKEVHVRVSCPPIVSPCFYGIDMSTRGELFAPPFTPQGYAGVPTPAMLAEMARALGIDSLRYLSVPDIAASLQASRRHPLHRLRHRPLPHTLRSTAGARDARRTGRRGRAGI